MGSEMCIRDSKQTDLINNAQEKLEAVLITAALESAGGKRTEAARLLGWGRNTLTRKIQALGLDL